jgi:hypothetical protein
MNIVPEHIPAAEALREDLFAKRGGVHLEVGRFVPADPVLEAERGSNVEGRAPGFHPPPGWVPLNATAAVAFIARALSSGAGADAPPIVRADAEALAVRVSALFSTGALYFTTGEAGNDSSAKGDTDSSLFVVDGDRAGLFWVERDADAEE